MPAKDAWGAAFYCGTSAGFRAEALLATQGMATETVTEDTHTSFKMEEHGYRTIYLKAAQHGARPGRVARLYHPASLGAIQQIYTRVCRASTPAPDQPLVVFRWHVLLDLHFSFQYPHANRARALLVNGDGRDRRRRQRLD
jgi:Glycosyl transferase family group 2